MSSTNGCYAMTFRGVLKRRWNDCREMQFSSENKGKCIKRWMLLKLDWQDQDNSVIHPKADSTKNDLVKKGQRASFVDYKMRTRPSP